MDEVGEFTIAGTVSDDGTATLTKSYRSHSVNYLGMIQGTKLRGIWTLSDVTGEFEVQDIQYWLFIYTKIKNNMKNSILFFVIIFYVLIFRIGQTIVVYICIIYYI